MFPNPKPKSKLQIAIDQILLEMESHSANSEEYGTLVDRLKELEKIQTEKSYRPSADTVVLAAANLIGVALIIRHEQFNVITSNALRFVRFR